MQRPMRVGGWVRRQGRKVGRRRKLEVGWKVEPEDGSKAQAGGSLEGMAERSAGGASRRPVKRRGRRVDRRRKSQVVRKAGPEGRSKAQAGDRQEGWPWI
jgi:hypothetical protein